MGQGRETYACIRIEWRQKLAGVADRSMDEMNNRRRTYNCIYMYIRTYVHSSIDTIYIYTHTYSIIW